MTNYYEPDMAEDDRLRCVNCRNSFWPNGDITVCEICEEWVCEGCRPDHIKAHEAE